MALALPDGSVFGLLTPEQAAAYLGVSARELRKLVATDGLRWVLVGKRKRFRVGDLEAWADARAFQSSSCQQERKSISAASPSTGVDTVSPLALEIAQRLNARRGSSTHKRSSVSLSLVPPTRPPAKNR